MPVQCLEQQPSQHREKGVALVIVLGLVAIIGAWASQAAYEDMVSLRRAENMQDAMRAVQASQSAFAMAKQLLRQDVRDSQQDDMDEGWAQQTPPFPLDDGMVTGYVYDANRHINLNDLVDGKGQLRPNEFAVMRRLFSSLELDPGLVEALADWMDADDRPLGSNGAEDAAYYDKLYRVKNARLDRWDELRLIRGFDQKVLARLAEAAMVRAVPLGGGVTAININTAGKVVLLALFEKMTDVDAEAIIAGRPYADVVTAIANQPWAVGVDTARLSVSSDVFMVRTEARFGRAVLREEYMLLRQPEKMTLLARERMAWNHP
jgi:general secretion pathway protein K